jgi:hypothetical protein
MIKIMMMTMAVNEEHYPMIAMKKMIIVIIIIIIMKMEFFPDAEVLQWWDLLLLGAAEKRW